MEVCGSNRILTFQKHVAFKVIISDHNLFTGINHSSYGFWLANVFINKAAAKTTFWLFLSVLHNGEGHHDYYK